MRKKLQLQIPLPCHEDWDKMTPVEKGRFCSSCQKPVIDFTGMSDTQVFTFFKKSSTGSVCGRFQEDQLNRDMRMPPKRLPWIKYFFQFTLPAFLITMNAEAQKRKITGIVAIRPTQIKGKPVIKTVSGTIPIVIKGRVIDADGLGIPYAAVMFKGTQKGAATDSTGNFSISPDEYDSSLILVISCVGFQSVEKTVDMREYIDGTIVTMQLAQLQQSLGEVVVKALASGHTTGLVMRSTRITCTKEIIKEKIKDSIATVFNTFSIYPNPVISGHTLTLENEKLLDDNYDIEIVSQAGQVVYKEPAMIDNKQKISLRIPFVAAGPYFLKLTGLRTLKVCTKKIIIQ